MLGEELFLVIFSEDGISQHSKKDQWQGLHKVFSRLLAMRDRISSTFKDKYVNFLIKYETKAVLQIDKLV